MQEARARCLANPAAFFLASALAQESTVSMKQTVSTGVQCLFALGAIMIAGCGSTPGGRATVTVAPMCTIHAVSFSVNPQVDAVLVSERTDPSSNHGFTRFRGISAPRGNPASGATPGLTSDVYGFSEAWTHNSAGSVVVRAQAHPARRPLAADANASGWTINTQDAAGAWSAPIAGSSANAGEEFDTPPVGGMTVPQLMPVGLATPEVFGCAGMRSDDNAVRTTMLIEVVPANAATPAPSRANVIQDLLSGDDRFVRNPSVPLGGIGPNVPPTPRITNRPGQPVREGTVQCAMTQFEDDVSTRELHMVAIRNGVLHHSMASSFGAATRSTGLTFNRFNAVSTWGDVGQALGGGFGNIIDVAIVARPRALHVFFVAQSGSSTRLWHAVRFSANGGSWRAADDVLALNGAHSGGAGFPFRIGAGLCPLRENPQETELVYSMWNDRLEAIWSGRVVSTSRQWLPGLTGTYSPLFDMAPLMGRSSDASRQATIDSMVIGTRPFRDDARPPP